MIYSTYTPSVLSMTRLIEFPKKHKNSFALDSCIFCRIRRLKSTREKSISSTRSASRASVVTDIRCVEPQDRLSIHPLTSAGSSQADREKVYKACFRQFSVLTRRWQWRRHQSHSGYWEGEGSVFCWAVKAGAGAGASLVCAFFFFSIVVRRFCSELRWEVERC